MTDATVQTDSWQALRRFTDARIALGRAGHALPTQAVMAFQLCHAQARDAVNQAVDFSGVAAGIDALGFDVQHLHSQATDRAVYLQRPDLGRLLAADAQRQLQATAPTLAGYEVVFVIGDGLSAWAVERHALALLAETLARLAGIRLCPTVFLAQQARVALGDEVGAALQARLVVVLIGERPGLSSPDSLGIYLTYAPQRGRQNAERNCISNVRPEGLGYGAAASALAGLIREALRLQLSGVGLKLDVGSTAVAGNECLDRLVR